MAWCLGSTVGAAPYEAKIQSLEARLNRLESMPPRLELNTPTTVLTLGGQIQFSAVYGWPETDGRGIAKNIDVPTPVGESGQLYTSARESRMWFKTRTLTPWGLARTLVEVDFRGTSGTETATNGHGIRLRHAYVDVQGWAVGQTNSLFNTPTRLETLSFPINDTLIRQPMVRYRTGGSRVRWEVSLEQPETQLYAPNGGVINPSDDAVPDMVTRIRYFAAWGEASCALLGRYLVQDRATLKDATLLPQGDHAWGWGSNISAKVSIGTQDDLRVNAQFGEGIGRYIGFGSFAAGSVDTMGRITLHQIYGAHGGYRHWWNDQWRSTFAVAMVEIDNAKNGPTQVTQRATSMAINLIYSPFRQFRIGMEYTHSSRTLERGAEGEGDQLKTVLRYRF